MNNNYLAHHGVLGQKWGVRRYQNYDGSLKNSTRALKKQKRAAEKTYDLEARYNAVKNNELGRYRLAKTAKTVGKIHKGMTDVGFVLNAISTGMTFASGNIVNGLIKTASTALIYEVNTFVADLLIDYGNMAIADMHDK